jgi:hypothetical protein
MSRFTPEEITELGPDEIFVFGSNTEGRHGAGAAKTARMLFGAKYGQAEGLQGRSYAIITKDLSLGMKSIPLTDIYSSVRKFMHFALDTPQKTFVVVKLGCSLAGYSIKQIGDIFRKFSVPNNVVLPIEFTREYGQV